MLHGLVQILFDYRDGGWITHLENISPNLNISPSKGEHQKICRNTTLIVKINVTSFTVPYILTQRQWIYDPRSFFGSEENDFSDHDVVFTQNCLSMIFSCPPNTQTNVKHISSSIWGNDVILKMVHPRNLIARPWKMMVGKWVSFWDAYSLGAMLNFRGVAA